jgi:hypothetical protein
LQLIRTVAVLIWSHKISEYNGVAGSVSRQSPAVDHDQLIIGDLLSKQVHDGANLIAVDRETGNLRWKTQVDSHPAAIITGSPVVFDGVVYSGVSSLEETLSLDPSYPCCSFRGSVVALNAKTGAMLWTSVAATAATVYLPRATGLLETLVLSLNAGLWCGAVIALAGSRCDLLNALPCVLGLLPAAWMIRQRATIVVKVVSSWLIAVSVLTATLQFLPVTPGYLPDHID